ncbi:MAG: HAD-IA family hydrolase [Chromatiales bacterium]|nr:HAD-IA family hydrolase [Chromatiales bacterium]
MTIRAISFDLDDTLWPVAPIIVRAEERLQRWLEQHHQPLAKRYAIADFRELRKTLMRSDPALRIDLSELRKQSLRIAARQVGLDPVLAEPAFAVFHEARNQVQPYPDTLPALEQLAPDYPLIAISNGNAEIHRTVLAPYFRFGISAEQIGVAKPDPLIFQHACERLALSAAELLHIGDDWDTDIQGAVAAGIACIWVNRKRRPRPKAPTEVVEVTDLSTLEAVLRQTFQLPVPGAED